MHAHPCPDVIPDTANTVNPLAILASPNQRGGGDERTADEQQLDLLMEAVDEAESLRGESPAVTVAEFEPALHEQRLAGVAYLARIHG